MILACPSCATRFAIDPQILGAAGRTVRCARCKQQWFVKPPLITLPADMPASAQPEESPMVAVMPPPVAVMAQAQETGIARARRNAVLAALFCAVMLALPIFTWRMMDLSKSAALIMEQKSIVLDGTPITQLSQEDGHNVLKIDGAIVNNAVTPRKMPKLRAQGLNATGRTVKEWMIPIPQDELEPGQRLPFSFTTPFSEQGVVDIAFQFM